MTGMAIDRFLTFRLDARDGEVRLTLARITAVLVGLGIPPDDRASVEIVLAEILNNIVEHGYAPGDPGPIWIALLMEPAAVQVTISDFGRPLPAALLNPAEPPDPQSLPEGGFGWFLIHSLTTDLRAGRTGTLNRLSFRLPRGATDTDAPQAPPRQQ